MFALIHPHHACTILLLSFPTVASPQLQPQHPPGPPLVPSEQSPVFCLYKMLLLPNNCLRSLQKRHSVGTEQKYSHIGESCSSQNSWRRLSCIMSGPSAAVRPGWYHRGEMHLVGLGRKYLKENVTGGTRGSVNSGRVEGSSPPWSGSQHGPSMMPVRHENGESALGWFNVWGLQGHVLDLSGPQH